MLRNKRVKNRFMMPAFLLALVLAAGSLSACRQEDSSGNTSSAVSEQSSTQTVSVSEASSGSEDKQTIELPADLEELHDSIEDFAFTPEMEALSGGERAEKTADYLKEMEASGLIEEGSVTAYPEMELVSFRQEDGCLVFVDFREYEDGTMGGVSGYEAEAAAKTLAVLYRQHNRKVLLEPEYRKITPSGRDTARIALFTATDPASPNNSMMRYKGIQQFIDDNTEISGEVVLASPQNMRYSLKGLDMAILELHGALYPIGEEVQTCIQVYVETNILTSDPERTEDYLNDRMFCYIGKDQATGKTGPCYMITPSFFHYYYGDGGLLGMIIHMGSCYAFGGATEAEPYGSNYVLSDTLLNCGAEAVVGHHNSVYMDYDEALVMTELDYLKDARTLEEGLEAAIQLYGDNDKIYITEHTEGNTTDDFEAHVPSHTSIRGNKDAVLFLETVVNYQEPTPTPQSGGDVTPLHPEAPDNPGGTVHPDEPQDENWRAAYYRILRQYPSSARFVLMYTDGDLVPELYVAENGAHVDAVDIYTYKQGQAACVGTLGSFGTVQIAPYDNIIISKVEYFGTSDITVYRIDGFSLTLIRSLFTNENSSEQAEKTYELDGESVSEGRFNIAKDALYNSDDFYDIGYGPGFENSDANQNAMLNAEKSFSLVLG